MLLKSLKVTNGRGSVLELPLENPSGGFIVKDVEGLGPVKATLVSSSFANQDGAQYHSGRREARNIIIRLALDPDYGMTRVQNLRSQLYAFFMPKSKAKLEFTLFDQFATNLIEQTLELEIEGRIEDFESTMFTDKPGVDISIMCFDPDFVDPEVVLYEGASGEGGSEFVITYDGTIETGAKFRVEMPHYLTLPGFTIYHQTAEDDLRILEFTEDLVPNAILDISSELGSKHATMTTGGVERSVLYGISPQSSWLQLYPGDNYLHVDLGSYDPLPFSIEYTNKYGGL